MAMSAPIDQPETKTPPPVRTSLLRKLVLVLRLIALTPRQTVYWLYLCTSRGFDVRHYRRENPELHWLFRLWPRRHFIVHGEAEGRAPNAEFSPFDYVRLNPDLGEDIAHPFFHYLRHGHKEQRLLRDATDWTYGHDQDWPVIRPFELPQSCHDVAIHLHLYYFELWEEFEETLSCLAFPFDFYVTLTAREGAADLQQRIQDAFPDALVWITPNRGRDIAPFLHLVNADVFTRHKAVVKLHGKKSPHRVDGDHWRQHLVSSILPPDSKGLRLMKRVLLDQRLGVLVADGQRYHDAKWWGTNQRGVARILARAELRMPGEDELRFPAGSIYWVKAELLDLLRGLQLGPDQFDLEFGQMDGTVAHAFERAIGPISEQNGLAVMEVSECAPLPRAKAQAPTLISAFYLPQFHPIAINDRYWGEGYTEWRAVAQAEPRFEGHRQPFLPGALGYYDLRVTEVMAAQSARARTAGIGAFCVYHYWFDGETVLDAPLRGLLTQPQVDFPFYLCWANESWRRNWDGLSGDVIIEQSYAEGCENALASSVVPYMRDARYLRPDGMRPRFVIYRPEDIPEPQLFVQNLRHAFHAHGVGEVELGAVLFHLDERRLGADLFDFWVEMPPHGVVKPEAHLLGGAADRTKAPLAVHPGFNGLVYDYQEVIEASLSDARLAELPPNTIPGVMTAWDNTARRGAAAHIAWGANPVRFAQWIERCLAARRSSAYQGELFINAWNEWGEKAVLEPSQQWGDAWLRALYRAQGR